MRLLRKLKHWFLCSPAEAEFLGLVALAGNRAVETRCRRCGLVAVSKKLAGV
jgi:hypothetical protein